VSFCCQSRASRGAIPSKSSRLYAGRIGVRRRLAKTAEFECDYGSIRSWATHTPGTSPQSQEGRDCQSEEDLADVLLAANMRSEVEGPSQTRPLLVPLHDLDEFAAAKDVDAVTLSRDVLATVRGLHEVHEIEPFLTGILADSNETPHGPAEIVDILTHKVSVRGQPTLAAFIIKGPARQRGPGKCGIGESQPARSLSI
jgi:hypothetical protein